MSRLKCSLCASACARVKLLRGFWARGRVRGDRSVFVTSHRPVHSSRALLFSAWFELLHFRRGAIFLVCPPATPLHLHVFGFGAFQGIATGVRTGVLCELHTPPPLFPRVQRTASIIQFASHALWVFPPPPVPQGSEDSVYHSIASHALWAVRRTRVLALT